MKGLLGPLKLPSAEAKLDINLSLPDEPTMPSSCQGDYCSNCIQSLWDLKKNDHNFGKLNHSEPTERNKTYKNFCIRIDETYKNLSTGQEEGSRMSFKRLHVEKSGRVVSDGAITIPNFGNVLILAYPPQKFWFRHKRMFLT